VLAELIRAVWTRRADRYSELRASLTPAAHEQRKVEMFYIGG
jgi:GTP 3',8-cyclase